MGELLTLKELYSLAVSDKLREGMTLWVRLPGKKKIKVSVEEIRYYHGNPIVLLRAGDVPLVLKASSRIDVPFYLHYFAFPRVSIAIEVDKGKYYYLQRRVEEAEGKELAEAVAKAFARVLKLWGGPLHDLHQGNVGKEPFDALYVGRMALPSGIMLFSTKDIAEEWKKRTEENITKEMIGFLFFDYMLGRENERVKQFKKILADLNREREEYLEEELNKPVEVMLREIDQEREALLQELKPYLREEHED